MRPDQVQPDLKDAAFALHRPIFFFSWVKGLAQSGGSHARLRFAARSLQKTSMIASRYLYI